MAAEATVFLAACARRIAQCLAGTQRLLYVHLLAGDHRHRLRRFQYGCLRLAACARLFGNIAARHAIRIRLRIVCGDGDSRQRRDIRQTIRARDFLRDVGNDIIGMGCAVAHA
ncbi:hypothetical protein D3C72_1703910 [compost metagenome]